MEIRPVFIILLFGAVADSGSVKGSPIKTYPSEHHAIYTIGVGVDAPTTCLFPGPLTALEAANVSTNADDRPPVLLSYHPGSSFFSVRALHEDARAAVNVIYRSRVFVLNFVTAPTPDRAVSFFDKPPGEAMRASRRVTPELLQNLFERARNFALLQEQYPALARSIDHATPGTVTQYRYFAATVEEVFRFDAEDTLVFRLSLLNSGDTPLRYDPRHLAVRVGELIFDAARADASGLAPPKSTTQAWIAITGAPDGTRANLSVHNRFSVVVPRAP